MCQSLLQEESLLPLSLLQDESLLEEKSLLQSLLELSEELLELSEEESKLQPELELPLLLDKNPLRRIDSRRARIFSGSIGVIGIPAQRL